MNALGERLPTDDSRIDIDIEMHDDSPTMNFSSRPYDTGMSAPLSASSESEYPSYSSYVPQW